jgi:riboflavin synthase
MFTGLVVERGRVTDAPAPSPEGGRRLTVLHRPELAARLGLGASLAVAGVCLTVIEEVAGGSTVEISPETLSRTTLGELQAGALVNLEPALRLGDTLGGHWVQGHVDGVAVVEVRADEGEHRRLSFSLPPELSPYLVEKGSVTLDGVSLTIAALDGACIEVAVIPHTLEATTLSGLAVGDRVNVEVDILAKLVAKMVARSLPGAGG